MEPMKFVVIETEGSSAFVPIFSTIASPAVSNITMGSNHDCAIKKSTSMIITAEMMMTDKGGVAPSWLVSTTQFPPNRALICLPRAF